MRVQIFFFCIIKKKKKKKNKKFVLEDMQCRPKMVILGSREQLCIHKEVSLLRGKAQTNACHFLCRRKEKRQCGHYSRVAGDFYFVHSYL